MSVVPTAGFVASLRKAGSHAMEAGQAGFSHVRTHVTGFSGNLSTALKAGEGVAFAKNIAVERPLLTGAVVAGGALGTGLLVKKAFTCGIGGTAHHARAASDRESSRQKGGGPDL